MTLFCKPRSSRYWLRNQIVSVMVFYLIGLWFYVPVTQCIFPNTENPTTIFILPLHWNCPTNFLVLFTVNTILCGNHFSSAWIQQILYTTFKRYLLKNPLWWSISSLNVRISWSRELLWSIRFLKWETDPAICKQAIRVYFETNFITRDFEWKYILVMIYCVFD